MIKNQQYQSSHSFNGKKKHHFSKGLGKVSGIESLLPVSSEQAQLEIETVELSQSILAVIELELYLIGEIIQLRTFA